MNNKKLFKTKPVQVHFVKIVTSGLLIDLPPDDIFILTEKGFKVMPSDIKIDGAIILFRRGELYTVLEEGELEVLSGPIL